MKYLFHILLLLLCSSSVHGQTAFSWEEGSVSFLSTRNVYVKFASTKKIAIGDTLFLSQSEKFIPATVVSNKASTSIVSSPLENMEFKVGTALFAKVKGETKDVKKEVEANTLLSPEEDHTEDDAIAPNLRPEINTPETPLLKQKIKGRISAASYSNMSDYRNRHRMRYSFNFTGKNIKQSKFSFQTYINFRHTLGEWDRVQENLNQALKIYNLSAQYDFDSTSTLVLGRKINSKISSMGAIDGLQYEKRFGNFTLGAILGSRPDFLDYSINPNLFQTGLYMSLANPKTVKKYRQTTFGFIEQRNRGHVDRRLMYFQHSGQLSKRLSMFGSFEVDLYENINNEIRGKVELTNLYVSFRYRLSRKFQLRAAYDNRKNIIYYESYKDFIERLIENETRQGLRLGFTYRPFKYISWGINSSLRFQKNKENEAKNLSTYLNISRVPVLNLRANIRANFLRTGYLDSNIYSLRLSKSIVKGILNADAYYRRVNYFYKNSESQVQQNVIGSSLSLRLIKKLTFYFYYEGTFDSRNQKYQRFNTKIIQRF